MDSADPRVQCIVDGSVAIVTLARPDKLNSLDAEMVRALAVMCRDIEATTTVRAVIITGSGKAFCAGGDIQAWNQQGADDFGRFWVREGHLAFDRLARLRQPVIALLNGHALGGGLELAACADYRIAEDHVKVGQPETGIGIIPGWSGTQRLSRRFGSQPVRRMSLFGEVFTASEAMELGIVDQLCATGQGMAAARTLADRISERGPRATELCKMLINVAEGEEQGRVVESLAGSLAAQTDQLQEGINAFVEKRKPDFKD